MRITIRGQLIAIYDELYTHLVFRNLDESRNSLMRYITITRLPNWINAKPELGDIGFVEYEYVEAGSDYFCRKTGETTQYKYNGNYFINFIKEQEKIKNKEFKF